MTNSRVSTYIYTHAICRTAWVTDILSQCRSSENAYKIYPYAKLIVGKYDT